MREEIINFPSERVRALIGDTPCAECTSPLKTCKERRPQCSKYDEYLLNGWRKVRGLWREIME